MTRCLPIFFAITCFTLTASPWSHAEFQHPGISHTADDIAFVKAKLASGHQPWADAWKDVRSSRYADLNWNPTPHAHVERGPYNRPNIGSSDFSNDASAAYRHAVLWVLTDNRGHAEKSAEILNAWSSTLRSVSNHDARLLIGMEGYEFCNAAELLKHTWDDWSPSDQDRFARMLREVFYPIIKDFYPSANGNWDASMMQTMLAMGVYLDDQAMFDRGVNYFLSGDGNGAIGNYFKPSGQCQESGRDQAHTQMGLDFLACTAEIAWNQDIDLYAALDHRLLAGFEYTAKYNLGFDVPYEPYRSFEGRYHYKSISDDSRGRLRPMYEKVLNHYEGRLGLNAPYTRMAAIKLRQDFLTQSRPDSRAGVDRDREESPQRRERRRRRHQSSAMETLMFSGQAANPGDDSIVVMSPSQNHAIHFSLISGTPQYQVTYKGQTVLSNSQLGLEIGGGHLRPPYIVEGTETKSQQSSWEPVVGSKSHYPDAFNECIVHLRSSQSDDSDQDYNSQIPRRLTLLFRAYDEGVAFRYVIPDHDGKTELKIESENTEFQFTEDHFVYWDDYPQAEYSKVRLSEMGDHGIRPLLVETDAHFVAIAEAGDLENYAPLSLDRNGPNRLISRFRHGTVSASLPLSTPWRVVMVSEQPGTLVENHYLLQNLSPPCALEDTSWIKPGKVWRSSLTTAGAKAIVDYAAANNYQYVHFDAGWYGPERDAKSNPVTVIDEIDMPEAIRYADEHGIGVICYINKIAMARYDLDNTFRTYRQWGLSGVKMGFVDWRSQSDMRFLFACIRKAAEYELVVDIHDNFRLTGIERTYPHLLTVEGILGNEERASRRNPPQNVLTTSFARMIAGAGDYTPCYLDNRVVSRSFQLALGVVFYSPLQYLHWYDQADRYAGRSFPELEFWKAMPTTWDDSKVIHGVVGESMTVARRSGDQWFVGTIVDEATQQEIPLDFLDTGDYTAKIFAEDPRDKLKVSIHTRNVTADDVINATISQGSGHAVWIFPTNRP
ncbi:glycoside hydrolase family 97 catalytic domain-containing protein [Crateriforma spongiae]|uniref:glycoside hydrolase family 97 catalytic domain-containing protein n=1 Tax=Crateriforma spongiae TaxID=2724528 RepID=UPI001F293EF4|nr:glycoside hydrolase family 97 N-terminal domain-containing protein [Crateriforma spongiae]